MAVEHYGEVYRCMNCGNKVQVFEVGGGTLVCCDKEMKKIDDGKITATINIPDSGE